MVIQGFGLIPGASYKPPVRGGNIHTSSDLSVSREGESLNQLAQRVSELGESQKELNQATEKAIESFKNISGEVRKIREEANSIAQTLNNTVEQSENKRDAVERGVAETEEENRKFAQELTALQNRSLMKDLYGLGLDLKKKWFG
jgi:uncharacterized protein YoxC